MMIHGIPVDLIERLALLPDGQIPVADALKVVTLDDLRELDAVELICVQRWFCPLFDHEIPDDAREVPRVPDGPPFSPARPSHALTPSWRAICDSLRSTGHDQYRVVATELGKAALGRRRRERAATTGENPAGNNEPNKGGPKSVPMAERLRGMAAGTLLGPDGKPLSPLQRSILRCLVERRGGMSVEQLLDCVPETRDAKTIRNNLGLLKRRGIPVENKARVGYYLALDGATSG